VEDRVAIGMVVAASVRYRELTGYDLRRPPEGDE